ncbi:MAG: hypothetical protein Q8N53_13740 [Longimicrobiales bacterium]|nr:hypothetical protein [Longimicrobiales bacterium]
MASDREQSGELPWVPQDDYTPEALAACEKALRTIVSRIGKWGPRLILFGGLAPRYLVKSPPPELKEHTGTTDLDVVIGVEIDIADEGVYTKLQEELKKTGFSPSKRGSFAWERKVDGVRVILEFFCPVEPEGGPGSLKRNPGGEAGSSVSAIQLRGAEIAATDCAKHTLAGEVLDHGGYREVEVHVANILPFLVLKAFALMTRDKEKDAYDIVWTLQAFGEAGPASAAEAAAGSPVVDREEVAEAMAILEEHFSELSGKGPSNYSRFFLGGRDDAEEERTRLRRDARGTVQVFLARWKELRG